MSQVTIHFDKPRTLIYRWADMRSITARLGNCSMVEFLTRIGQTSPDALHTALLVGLGNEDERLTGKRLDDLIQGYIDQGGQLTTLVNSVLEAMQADGLLYKEKKQEASDGGNPPRA